MARRYYFRSRKGATAIEYTLIAAGIALAIVVAVFTFGDMLNVTFFTRLPEALGL
ncbi:MAG: Flp family type IVb pilin [Alphaproteobacteria bacterium]|nr:Flp family type IVb pilin [Alphaproteobacteria bacterium]